MLAAPADVPDAWDHQASGSPEEDGSFRLSFQPMDPVVAVVVAPTFAEPLHRLLER